MKKNDRKALKESLLSAIIVKLKENNAELTNKFEKAIRKSIKQIVKKARTKRTTDLKKSKKISAPKAKTKA